MAIEPPEEPDGASRPTAPAAVSASPPAEIRVVAAVIRRGDRFLVCERPHHKRHGGLWEFPGGKCEAGETDAAALRRELLEELGVELLHCDEAVLERHDEGSPYVIAFFPVEVEGEPAALEHSRIFWGTLDQIATLPLAPSDAHLVAFLAALRGP